ncbi:protein kinase/lanthionine synthetase C family protein [Actinoallomurus purpureus]|uniref:protein kinase/lanthionine synthetase C family protein n=1 Tax=Actinoallomurus purpureus TaxID=478114 RepID=UPI002092B6F3|nr:protein kinase/lanthionine synthetase C family protein [Actinoallomurus purpureus]MCO6010629.1 protein kinase/lanthionine synthetase C family protein [Actinoallomurus purpureus]
MEGRDSDAIEKIVREHARTGHSVHVGPTWLTVFPDGAPLPEHGWKLHVSSRSAAFAALVERLLPRLLAAGCVFKLARSRRVLDRLNNGYDSPATVGKAFTIYPDQRRLRELGLELAELLRGHQGPRVLSDRRVDQDAPVYYRYGPFKQPEDSGARGRFVARIDGPGGEEFEGLAGLRYEQPSWAVDPFTGRRADEETALTEPTVLGHHYRVVAGIYESARGNVYRAVDQRDGMNVVVKQARALVDEHAASGDIRMRLRNERRVLQILEGRPGVPRFLDHFRHGQDEFLVTSDVGPINLAEDVARNGPYPLGSHHGAGDGRSLERLGRRLAEILLDLHARGIVMRDLTPRNVVIDRGRVSVIDFGVASYDGLHIPGGTEGYAPPRQRRGEPPRDTDDLHALAMTLLFATSYLRPVTLGDDVQLPRRRALQTIRFAYGEEPTGMISIIVDLLGGDDTARRALRRLAAEEISARPPSEEKVKRVGFLPAPPSVTPELAADVAGNLLADLLGQARGILTGTLGPRSAEVHRGMAGIGLELLEHLGEPGVADSLHDLAAATAHAAPHLPPGLFHGRTGIDVFLSRARDHGIELPDGHLGARIPDAEWEPEGLDLIAGAAGVGIGHLLLSEQDGDPAHRAVVRRCVESVMEDGGLGSTADGDRPRDRDPVDPYAGLARGDAGAIELLISVGERTGDQRLLTEAAKRAERLSEYAGSWVRRAREGSAPPLAFSWCRGLAGIARTLLHTGAALDDPALTDLAREAGAAMELSLPRIGVLDQCCGAAGIGDALIDLAVHDGDPRRWDAARAVAVQMLLRSAGPVDHPVFVKDPGGAGAASLSTGLAGILGFFRRLARQGGETALPLPPMTPFTA